MTCRLPVVTALVLLALGVPGASAQRNAYVLSQAFCLPPQATAPGTCHSQSLPVGATLEIQLPGTPSTWKVEIGTGRVSSVTSRKVPSTEAVTCSGSDAFTTVNVRRLWSSAKNSRRSTRPRAAEARDILPNTLRQWGAVVDEIAAYRTVAAKGDGADLRAELLDRKIDMVTFTSSSTVNHFVTLFPADVVGELLAKTAVACIGPITQKTAEDRGIRVDVVARDYTIAGLTQAIVKYFSQKARSP